MEDAQAEQYLSNPAIVKYYTDLLDAGTRGGLQPEDSVSALAEELVSNPTAARKPKKQPAPEPVPPEPGPITQEAPAELQGPVDLSDLKPDPKDLRKSGLTAEQTNRMFALFAQNSDTVLRKNQEDALSTEELTELVELATIFKPMLGQQLRQRLLEHQAGGEKKSGKGAHRKPTQDQIKRQAAGYYIEGREDNSFYGPFSSPAEAVVYNQMLNDNESLQDFEYFEPGEVRSRKAGGTQFFRPLHPIDAGMDIVEMDIRTQGNELWDNDFKHSFHTIFAPVARNVPRKDKGSYGSQGGWTRTERIAHYNEIEAVASQPKKNAVHEFIRRATDLNESQIKAALKDPRFRQYWDEQWAEFAQEVESESAQPEGQGILQPAAVSPEVPLQQRVEAMPRPVQTYYKKRAKLLEDDHQRELLMGSDDQLRTFLNTYSAKVNPERAPGNLAAMPRRPARDNFRTQAWIRRMLPHVEHEIALRENLVEVRAEADQAQTVRQRRLIDREFQETETPEARAERPAREAAKAQAKQDRIDMLRRVNEAIHDPTGRKPTKMEMAFAQAQADRDAQRDAGDEAVLSDDALEMFEQTEVYESDEPQYTFMGPSGAARINHSNIATLRNAIVLDKSGVDMLDIYKETGWFKPKDGKWRLELRDDLVRWQLPPDSWLVPMTSDGNVWDGSSFEDSNLDWSAETKQTTLMKLGDVLNAPELFRAYPALEGVVVIPYFNPNVSQSGFLDIDSGSIYINLGRLTREYPGGPAAWTDISTMLHEIQHVIQYVEDFARGGDPNSTESLDFATRWNKAFNTDKATGYTFYRSLHGEVEAFDVGARYDRVRQEQAEYEELGIEIPSPDTAAIDLGLPELLKPENQNKLFVRRWSDDPNQPIAVKAPQVIVQETIEQLIGKERLRVSVQDRLPKGFGVFDPAQAFIGVAMDGADPVSAGAHEAWHAAEALLMTNSEVKNVRSAFTSGSTMRRRLEAVLKRDGFESLIPLLEDPKEAAAYGFQYYRKGALEATSSVGKVFDKLRAFFERLKNALQGQGYQNWQDVMDAFNQGEMVGRPSHRLGTDVESRKYLYNMMGGVHPDSNLGAAAEASHYATGKFGSDVKNFFLDKIPPSYLSKDGLKTAGVDSKEGIARLWRNTVGTRGDIIRRSKPASVVWHLIEDQYHWRNKIVEAAHNLMSSWTEPGLWSSLSHVRKDAKLHEKVGKVLFDQGVLRNRGTNTGALRQMVETELGQSWDALSVDDVNAWIDNNRSRIIETGMMSNYRTAMAQQGYSEREIEMYRGAREAIFESLYSAARAKALNYSLLGMGDLGKIGLLRDAVQLPMEGYIPHRRYGEHVVAVNAPGVKEPMGYFAFESRAEAERAAESLRNSVGENIQVTYTQRPMRNVDPSIGVDRILRFLHERGIEIPAEQRNQLIQSMTEAEDNVRNRLLQRQNIAGWSPDALRVISEFVQSKANLAADYNFRESIDTAMRTGDWERAEYQDYMTRTVDAFRRHGIDSELNDFATKWRAMAGLSFLGGNVSAALVQFTQIPVATGPWLTQYAPISRAYRYIAEALPVAGKLLSGDGVAQLKAAANRPNGSFAGLPTDVTQALYLALQAGRIQASQIYAIMGYARGMTPFNSLLGSRFGDWWMAPFVKAEEFNRFTTFVAAYRQGLELKRQGATESRTVGRFTKGQSLFGAGNRFDGALQTQGLEAGGLAGRYASVDMDVYDYAAQAVEDTQGTYERFNRPLWAQQGVGSVLFTFKMFPVIMTELLKNMNYRGKLTMLGTLVLASGLEGIPFAEDVEDVIDALSQNLFGGKPTDGNIRLALRELLQGMGEQVGVSELDEYMLHGTMDSLLGIDLSSRIGLGDLLPGTELLNRGKFDVGEFTEQLLGPIGSFANKAVNMTAAVRDGNWDQAMGQIPVSGIRNAYVGLANGMMEGEEFDQRGYMIHPVSWVQSGWRTLGFSPREVNRAWETSRMVNQTKNYLSAVRQEFMRDLVRARQDGDRREERVIWDAIRSWNDAHPSPTMRLKISGKDVTRAYKAARQTVSERALESAGEARRPGFEAAL